MVWSLRPSDVEVELLQVSRNIYESLEEETGVAPGWIKNGGIFIAYDDVSLKIIFYNQKGKRNVKTLKLSNLYSY